MLLKVEVVEVEGEGIRRQAFKQAAEFLEKIAQELEDQASEVLVPGREEFAACMVALSQRIEYKKGAQLLKSQAKLIRKLT